MNQVIEERIKETAARKAEEMNLELVHAEVLGTNKKLTVRIFIDKPDGVSHEDCVAMSRQLEAVFDAEDFIPAAYILEVSSPGIERGLYSLKDFEKFQGNPAKVKTEVNIDGQMNFRGRITAVEGEEIVFEDKTKGTVRLPYSAVAKANIEVDFEEELKKSEKRKAEGE